MGRVLGVLAVLAAVAACSEGMGPDEPAFEPAAVYSLRGQASGTVAGLSIQCAMDLVFEWNGASRLETGLVYVTAGGGDIERVVLDADGNGISVAPFLYSPENLVRVLDDGGLELTTPVNLGTGVPFYEAIGRMTGHVTGPGAAAGTWTCAPFDIPQDSVGAVPGTWKMEPLPTT